MNPLKMNVKSRIKELCERLNPRQRKAVVLGMLLVILCGCTIVFLRSVDRLIESSNYPAREITLDSLSRMPLPDSTLLYHFRLDYDHTKQ